VKKPEFPKRKNNKNSQYYRPERMIIKGCCKITGDWNSVLALLYHKACNTFSHCTD